jgi:hypothetical protein
MVFVKDGPFAVLYSKISSKSLSQTINEIILNLCSDLQIIIAKNEILLVSGKNCIVIIFSGEPKVKRLKSIGERKPGSSKRITKISIRIFRKTIALWDLEPFPIICIINLYIEIRESQRCKGNLKIFNDWAFWSFIVFILACID